MNETVQNIVDVPTRPHPRVAGTLESACTLILKATRRGLRPFAKRYRLGVTPRGCASPKRHGQGPVAGPWPCALLTGGDFEPPEIPIEDGVLLRLAGDVYRLAVRFGTFVTLEPVGENTGTTATPDPEVNHETV